MSWIQIQKVTIEFPPRTAASDQVIPDRSLEETSTFAIRLVK